MSGDPRFKSRLGHITDLEVVIQISTLLGICCNGASARTDWPGINTL